MLRFILSFLVAIALGGVISEIAYRFFRHELKRTERAPAPELSDRWKCPHTDLIEVDESATGEIVAYICVKCDEQVDFRDDAAKAYRQAQRIGKGWANLTDELTEDREVAQAQAFAARTRLAELAAGSPYVMVEPSLKGFKTEIRAWSEPEAIRTEKGWE